MIDPIAASMEIASSGLQVQSARLRIIAENMANAHSTSSVPGGDPYTRKTISFESEVDRTTGAELVRVSNIGVDPRPFKVNYDPSNPGADNSGFVKMPNVNIMTEMSDMREANQSYEASLEVFKQGRTLYTMTIGLLRNS